MLTRRCASWSRAVHVRGLWVDGGRVTEGVMERLTRDLVEGGVPTLQLLSSPLLLVRDLQPCSRSLRSFPAVIVAGCWALQEAGFQV